MNAKYSNRKPTDDPPRRIRNYRMSDSVIEELERLASVNGVTKSRMIETLILHPRSEYQGKVDNPVVVE